MSRSLLTIAVAVAVASAVGCAGTTTTAPPPSPAPPPLAEREAAPVPASAPERSAEDVWLDNAGRWSLRLFNQVEKFRAVVDSYGDAMSTANRIDRARREEGRSLLRSALADLEGCASSLQTDVGEPPSGGLLAVYRPLADACRGFKESSLLLANYYGVTGPSSTGLSRYWRDPETRDKASTGLRVAESLARTAEQELADAAR